MSKFNIANRKIIGSYLIPRPLIDEKKYSEHLTDKDLLTYSILKDNMNESVDKDWIDTNGDIYLIINLDELKGNLHCSLESVLNSINKLKELNLLSDEKIEGTTYSYLLEPVI